MLSKECTSLEVSKRLKELGVNQESLFYWVDNFRGMVLSGKDNPENEWALHPSCSREKYSAFMVSILGEVLRELSIQFPLWNFQGGFQWRMCGDYGDFLHLNGNEADARAEVLIWHVLNGLASVGQINEILEKVMT